jgi:hypothetical protein
MIRYIYKRCYIVDNYLSTLKFKHYEISNKNSNLFLWKGGNKSCAR